MKAPAFPWSRAMPCAASSARGGRADRSEFGSAGVSSLPSITPMPSGMPTIRVVPPPVFGIGHPVVDGQDRLDRHPRQVRGRGTARSVVEELMVCAKAGRASAHSEIAAIRDVTKRALAAITRAGTGSHGNMKTKTPQWRPSRVACGFVRGVAAHVEICRDGVATIRRSESSSEARQTARVLRCRSCDDPIAHDCDPNAVSKSRRKCETIAAVVGWTVRAARHRTTRSQRITTLG